MWDLDLRENFFKIFIFRFGKFVDIPRRYSNIKQIVSTDKRSTFYFTSCACVDPQILLETTSTCSFALGPCSVLFRSQFSFVFSWSFCPRLKEKGSYRKEDQMLLKASNMVSSQLGGMTLIMVGIKSEL